MNIINQYLSCPLVLCYGAITDSSSGVLGPLAISAGSSPSGNASLFFPCGHLALLFTGLAISKEKDSLSGVLD